MEIRVLGPVEVWYDDQRLAVGAARQRGVLALLASSAGEAVHADVLIEELWAGASPASARAALQSCVYRLRKLFGRTDLPEALQTRGTSYLLDIPGDALDLARFKSLVREGRAAHEAGDRGRAVETLRAGLGLWRGEAFAGVDAPAARDAAARLDDLRLDVAELCLAAELDLGRHGAAVGELEGLTTRYPLRERLWELLILAHYRCGRQADALDAYQRLYRLLDEELGVEPSPALGRLQERILNADPSLVHPRGTASAPHQLPAAINTFTGRADVLKQLDALLPATYGPPLALIIGTAGVGKTTLAVHWCHQIAERFPDGQLYVNLRGFDPVGQPVSSAEAVRGFLAALGVDPARVPVELDAQAALYRSLLANRRVLVLLDNAQDVEQVRPLLPGSPGCLVVVTSRNQLAGLVAADGARPIVLDLLTADEARALLESRLGVERVAAEPQAADEIVHDCARLPLALAMVAARAATHPTFPLGALAAELRGGRRLDALSFAGTDPASDVRALFSWSYRQLGSAAARLFRLLGLYPGPDISAPVCASLGGLPLAEIQPLLAELTHAQLVTEREPGRYALHDLLRAYAGELVEAYDTADERRQAIHRLLDHYAHTCHAADEFVSSRMDEVAVLPPRADVSVERFASREEAIRWLTTEHRVVLAAVALAKRAGFDSYTWRLAWPVDTYLQWQGHSRERVVAWRLALEAAQRSEDQPAQARAHRVLGHAYSRLGRLTDSRAHLQRALDLCETLGDRSGQAHTHRIFSMLCEWEDRFDDVRAHAEQALALYAAIGHRKAQADMLNSVGWAYTHLGNHERALEYCERAVALTQETGDRATEAFAWDSLGYAHARLGEHDSAVDCYRRALGLKRDTGDRDGQAGTLDHLGDIYHAVGDLASAQEYWRDALAVFEELGRPDTDDLRAKLASI